MVVYMKLLLKTISYCFGFLIFTITFLFLKVSGSFIDITSTELFFKPYLLDNVNQYNIKIHHINLYIDKSEHKLITNIKIDFLNKFDRGNHRLSSKVTIPIKLYLKSKSKYQFNILLNELNTNDIKTKNSNYNIIANGIISSNLFLISGGGTQLPIDLVKSLWPKSVGNGARKWVNKNLSNGKIENLKFNANIPLISYKIRNKLSKESLNLKFNFEEMKISFLKDMSSIHDASGEAFLDGEKFHSNLFKGKVKGIDHNEINLTNSHFIAHEFQKKHGPGEVDINADSNLRDLLLFLFQHPKDLKIFFPFDINSISAFSNTNTNFKFPLKSKITFEEIEISSNSKLKNIIVKDIYSKDITSDNLSVSVSNKEINILGNIIFENQNLNLKWNQKFNNNKDSAHVSFDGPINDKILNNFFEKTKLFFNGKILLKADFYGDLKGLREGKVNLDAKHIRIESKKLLWTKPKFSPLTISSKINFLNANNFLLEKITFDGPLLSVLGDMTINNNILKNAYFSKLRFHSSKEVISSDFSFNFTKDINDNINTSIIGKKLTVGTESLFSFLNFKQPSYNLNNFSLDISFDELISGTGVVYSKIKFLLEKNANSINNFQINVNLDNEEIITSKFSDNQSKNIELYSKNIENIIDLFGLNINVTGGPFDLRGKFNDDASLIFKGNIFMGEFSILKLPIFAKLLNVSLPNLTTLLDNNSGMEFKSASSQIIIDTDGVNIIDGVVKAKSDVPIFGNSLGMTLSGLYGFSKKTDISGTLVPLAGFNTAPSKLPVIGNLFKGGEKGQGLIGINFRIYEDKNNNIIIQSNPLSILAPGFLQRIF